MSRKIGWLPLLFVSALGFSGTPALPIWLAAAAERFHLTPAQSGSIATLEMGCLAAASIVVATLIRSDGGAKLLSATVALSIAGNIASFFAAEPSTLIAARIVTGIAYGLSVADITRRTARMPESHSIFAMQQLALVAFATVYFSTVSFAMAKLGPSAPFLYNAALGALALLSILLLPSAAEGVDAAAHPGGAASSAPKSFGAIAMALTACALTFVAQGSIWPYVASAARNSQVGLDMLGRILAVGALVNLAAPFISGQIGLRWGRGFPLSVGFGGLTISILLTALPLGPIWFTLGSIGLNFFIVFLSPFLFGTLAGLDGSGRSASAVPAFLSIGGAIGPVAGGLIVGGSGFVVLAASAAATAVLALILMWSASLRIAPKDALDSLAPQT